MNRQPIYVPLQGLDDWKRLLGDPEKHWKEKYSAKLTASSWHSASGFPAPLVHAFEDAGEPFASLSPLIIIPEHQVALPPAGRRPTQTDVWVLGSHTKGTASISVEGKMGESFGPTLDEWLAEASIGQHTRLSYLTELLGLPTELPGATRYQFLHRLASAVIEAKRFRADMALCVIQSFHSEHAGFSDFQNFVSLYDWENLFRYSSVIASRPISAGSTIRSLNHKDKSEVWCAAAR